MTITLLSALSLVLATGLLISLSHLKRYREERRQAGLFRPWPVVKRGIGDWDAAFRPSAHGPDRQTEIRFVPDYGVRGGISDLETWILCNLARRSRRIFEFGTCTGKTTYLLAANSPAGASITTLTLRPEDLDTYHAGPEDDRSARGAATRESSFTDFYYTGTPEERKIRQLYGDSKQFDEAEYRGACDLVFVDGSHAYSYVMSDSRKAMAMAAPGGVVVWHDYRGPRRTRDVYRALNELSRDLPLVHLAGTSFVVWRNESTR